MTLNQIKKIINQNLSVIQDKYRVKEIGIFGSYATGHQHKDSDVDVLVEFGGSITLFKYAELQ
ncbi:MAG: nucleotidyltransferase domain-containing protein, partial [Patescibacteria group bacterium]